MMASDSWQLRCAELKQRGAYLYQSKLWADCTFQLDDVTIKAHKLIMAMASPVFSKMLYGSFVKFPMPIYDVRPEVFNVLLEYIYSDNLNIKTSKDACDLYYAAKKWRLPYVAKCCVKYLNDHMSPDHVCHVYKVACESGDSTLQATCEKIFSSRTKEVLKDNSFYDIDVATVKKLFSIDPLNIHNELDLFEAVVEYAKFHDQNTKSRNVLRRTNEDSIADDGPSPPKKARSDFVDDEDPNDDSDPEELPTNTSDRSYDSNQDSANQLTPSKVLTGIRDKQKYRELTNSIRFLTLTPQEFAECSTLPSLLSESEMFALGMNVSSKETTYPMPEGFSTSMVPRTQATKDDRTRLAAIFRSIIHNFKNIQKYESMPFYLRNLAWTLMVTVYNNYYVLGVTCFFEISVPEWVKNTKVKVKFSTHKPVPKHLHKITLKVSESNPEYGAWVTTVKREDLLNPDYGFVDDFNTVTYKLYINTVPRPNDSPDADELANSNPTSIADLQNLVLRVPKALQSVTVSNQSVKNTLAPSSTTTSAILSQPKASPNVTQSQKRPNVTPSQIKPSPDATQTQLRPCPNVTQSQSRQYPNATPSQSKPCTNATPSQTKPVSNVIQPQTKLCPNVTQSHTNPFPNEMNQSHVRPSSAITQSQLSSSVTTLPLSRTSPAVTASQPSQLFPTVTALQQSRPSPTMTAVQQSRPSPTMTAVQQSQPFPTLTSMQQSRPSPTVTAMQQSRPSPTMTAIQQSQPFPTLTSMQQSRPSPTMTAVQQSRPSPIMKAVQQSRPSPTRTAVQQSQPFPTVTAMQQSRPSPTMTAIQQCRPSPIMTAMQQSRPSPTVTSMQQSRPSPTVTAVQQSRPSPTMTAVQQCRPSPTMTAMQQSRPSPTMTAVQQSRPSPIMTAMQQSRPSPTVTAVQQSRPSPTMTAVQQSRPSPTMTVVQQSLPFPTVTAMQQSRPSPTMTAVQQCRPSPTITAMQQSRPLPTVTAMQQSRPSPTMTVVQQCRPSPTTTAMQQSRPSPTVTSMQQSRPFPTMTCLQQPRLSPTMTAVHQSQRCPTMTASQQPRPSPTMTAVQQSRPSPTVTVMQDSLPSTTMTALQQSRPSPTLTAFHQSLPSPTGTALPQSRPISTVHSLQSVEIISTLTLAGVSYDAICRLKRSGLSSHILVRLLKMGLSPQGFSLLSEVELSSQSIDRLSRLQISPDQITRLNKEQLASRHIARLCQSGLPKLELHRRLSQLGMSFPEILRLMQQFRPTTAHSSISAVETSRILPQCHGIENKTTTSSQPQLLPALEANPLTSTPSQIYQPSVTKCEDPPLKSLNEFVGSKKYSSAIAENSPSLQAQPILDQPLRLNTPPPSLAALTTTVDIPLSESAPVTTSLLLSESHSTSILDTTSSKRPWTIPFDFITVDPPPNLPINERLFDLSHDTTTISRPSLPENAKQTSNPLHAVTLPWPTKRTFTVSDTKVSFRLDSEFEGSMKDQNEETVTVNAPAKIFQPKSLQAILFEELGPFTQPQCVKPQLLPSSKTAPLTFTPSQISQPSVAKCEPLNIVNEFVGPKKCSPTIAESPSPSLPAQPIPVQPLRSNTPSPSLEPSTMTMDIPLSESSAVATGLLQSESHPTSVINTPPSLKRLWTTPLDFITVDPPPIEPINEMMHDFSPDTITISRSSFLKP